MSSLKLSPETIAILENFASINQSIFIRPGSTISTIMPVSASVLARANVKETFESKIVIYDLRTFLGVLRLFKDPSIDVFDKKLVIIEGKRKVIYHFADEESIVFPPDKEIAIPPEDDKVLFKLESSNLEFLNKMGATLSLPERSITGADGKILVNALNSKNSEADLNEIEIGETDREFNLIFKDVNFNLFQGDYDVSVIKKIRVARFNGPIDYFIKYEQNSTI